LFVAGDDGEWQFTCGAADHDPDDSHVVCLGHLIDQDPSLSECADLPEGFETERSAVGEPWIRCQHRPADINAGETCDEPPSAPAAPLLSAAFEDLVVTATSYLRDCQESLKRSHFLDRWPRYDWSQETRQLIFSDGGRPKVVADIQFVGSSRPSPARGSGLGTTRPSSPSFAKPCWRYASTARPTHFRI
jgi:hypothetical protein